RRGGLPVRAPRRCGTAVCPCRDCRFCGGLAAPPTMPAMAPARPPPPDLERLKRALPAWGRELGFQSVGIAHIDLREDEQALQRWLELCRHGDMEWMARHGLKRARPAELVPGTVSVVCARMDYLPADAAPMQETLDDPQRAYVSRYALGRDYHKLLRGRLQKLADTIAERIGPFGYRV